MFLGVIAPLVTTADAAAMIGSITDNLVANLPFVIAIVSFGMIFGLVMHFVKHPGKK